MANQFDQVSKLVEDLQKRHDQLVIDIPKLHATKEGIIADINEANTKLVDIRVKTDEVLKQITDQTKKFNDWQNGKAAWLDKEEKRLSTEAIRIAREDEKNQLEIKDLWSHLDDARARLDEDTTNLNIAKQENEEQINVNSQWAEKLSEIEKVVNAEKSRLESLEEQLLEREADIAIAETKVKAIIDEQVELVKQAKQDRESAKQILHGAREKIADYDARQQALEIESRLIKDKERKLAQRERAFEDKQNVLGYS